MIRRDCAIAVCGRRWIGLGDGAYTTGKRCCLPAFLAAFGLLLTGLAVQPISAQDEETLADSREYRIKAAYLYQFGRYIEWPARAFSSPESPFIIGVMDDDPIAVNLDRIAQIKKVQNRPLEVRRFASLEDIGPCHILFISSALPVEAQTEILRHTERQGVLPVGEDNGFLEWGGAIRFVVEENKVRLYIARKAVKREGLSVSAKLLQIAHVVD